MLRRMHHLVGPHEIARMLGVTRQRVDQLANEPGFPEPEVVLSRIRVWRTEDIRQWAERTGRTIHDDTE
jgi:predicted DNA-binding transcriptional regulator AlpA